MKKTIYCFVLTVLALCFHPIDVKAFVGNLSWSNAPGDVAIGVTDSGFESHGGVYGWVFGGGKTGSGTWDGVFLMDHEGKVIPPLDPAGGPYRLVAFSGDANGVCCHYMMSNNFNLDNSTINFIFTVFKPLISIDPARTTVDNGRTVNYTVNFQPGAKEGVVALGCPEGVAALPSSSGPLCGTTKTFTLNGALSKTFSITFTNSSKEQKTAKVKATGYYSQAVDDYAIFTSSVAINPVVVPPPPLQIISPRGGGEIFLKTGEQLQIKWNTPNASSASRVFITVNYKTKGLLTQPDGSSRSFPLTTYGIPNTGSYSWMIPPFILQDADPKSFSISINLYDGSHLGNFDTGTFTIHDLSVASVMITSPNKGATLRIGSSEVITWAVEGSVRYHPVVKLFPYTDSCRVADVERTCLTNPYIIYHDGSSSNTGRTGSFTWIVGKTIAGENVPPGTYMILMCKTNGTSCDAADKPITLVSAAGDTVTETVHTNVIPIVDTVPPPPVIDTIPSSSQTPVVSTPTSVSLNITPTSVVYGSPITIVWSSDGATECVNNWGGGAAKSGSMTLVPLASKRYQILCTDSTGTAKSQAVSVYVTPYNSPSMSPSPSYSSSPSSSESPVSFHQGNSSFETVVYAIGDLLDGIRPEKMAANSFFQRMLNFLTNQNKEPEKPATSPEVMAEEQISPTHVPSRPIFKVQNNIDMRPRNKDLFKAAQTKIN